MTDLTKSGPFERSTFQARELSIWTPPPRAPEVDYANERDLAMARARNVAVFSPYGVNALRTQRTSVVGTNFKLALRPDNRFLDMDTKALAEWVKTVEREWDAYANSPLYEPDAARKSNFTWLMNTAYCTFLMSGEAIGAIAWDDGALGNYKTCLQLVEPERVSQPFGKPETPKFRRGIETNEFGAPMAYHFRQANPGDYVQGIYADQTRWKREERFTPWGRTRVVHMLDNLRPEMFRGLSQYLASLKSMKMLDMYDAAELEAAVVQAGFAAVIKSELNNEDANAVLGAVPVSDVGSSVNDPAARALNYMASIQPYYQEMALTVAGAKVVHLMPGESLETVKPNHPGLSYPDFNRAITQKLAAALGVSYEQLSRDFSQTSYAAARMSLGDVWRHFLCSRDLLVRAVALPFFFAWLEEAIDNGSVALPNGKRGSVADMPVLRRLLAGRTTFISWGMPSIDSAKERKGQTLALDARLTSLADEAAADGRDWEDTIDQIEREREYLKEKGIPLPEEVGNAGPEGFSATTGDNVGEFSSND